MTRVRFAPSPTGNLHIGTCRTALFNWIFARQQKGTCVLRIEDTDLERSDAAFEGNINAGLEWLGLTADEGPEQGGDAGPYRQSERHQNGLYAQYVEQLLSSGDAYYCFETPEELEAERQAAIDAGKPYVYSRKALALSPEEVAEKRASGIPSTIRFKMPAEQIEWPDIIRGNVQFDTALISDFIIQKSDQTPSYNFAVVVDDITMGMTHVIRGEDHISNTPRQIALFRALKATAPLFAHMPMILGPDKSKLSKRHGATAITDYQNAGFLKEAFLNYLCLLGWTPPNQQEIMDIESIIQQFKLEDMNKAGAVFDVQKLTWMNGQYIRKMTPKALLEALKPFMSVNTLAGLAKWSIDDQFSVIQTIQDNLNHLTDVNDCLAVYLETDSDMDQKRPNLQLDEDQLKILGCFVAELQQTSDLDTSRFKSLTTRIHDEVGGPKGKIFKTLRLGVTGEPSGPNLADCLRLLGVETCMKRAQETVDYYR